MEKLTSAKKVLILKHQQRFAIILIAKLLLKKSVTKLNSVVAPFESESESKSDLSLH